jgi:hypothetical protein
MSNNETLLVLGAVTVMTAAVATIVVTLLQRR